MSCLAEIPSAEVSVAKLVEGIHDIAKQHEPLMPGVGVVIAPPPNIVVKYNNIELTKEQVYISHYLLVGYERTAKGHLVSATQNRGGGGGYAEYESHNHDIDNDYTDNIIYTDTLKAGDIVSIFACSGSQLYIITDKLVKL